eukprot:maker-scaffold_60-snap-gene-0.55-mRNA-1 protein AED:0.03 eAED:0.03 QI:133/1/1/1/1/1/3/107/265
MEKKESSVAEKRKEELEKEYRSYIDNHPEIQETLSDLLSQLIISKPKNIFAFGKTYFQNEYEKNVFSSYLPILMMCGPSGVGKGTLVKKLLEKYPEKFSLSVSSTTRDPREGEVDGKHYNFTSKEDFEKKIDKDYFLESANVHGNYYGTSYAAVQKICSEGKVCILEIDVQGTQKVLEKDLGRDGRKIVYIAPPNFEELEKRLRKRGTETEEQLVTRMENAKTESEWLESSESVTKKLVNEDRNAAFKELDELVKSWYPEVFESS